MPRSCRAEITTCSLAELEAWCRTAGEPAYRARQVLAWVHRREAASFAAMTDLPQRLRARLEESFSLTHLWPAAEVAAPDGTRKLLYELPPAAPGRPVARVESVLIPDGERLTLCVSAQAGCALGCAFCATARMGLVRNLHAAEIVGQVVAGRRLAVPRRVTNVVFMGMGEPLANEGAVLAALRAMSAEWGLGISPRRITVSTAGIAPRIGRLVGETRVNLAISLNATTDAEREGLMPVNRRYPLAVLLAACRSLPLPRRRRITFAYVLLHERNDSEADARRLVHLLAGLRAKVNLIPMNPVPGSGLAPSSAGRAARFRELLESGGLAVTLRESRGQDIRAACGQLATFPEQRSAA